MAPKRKRSDTDLSPASSATSSIYSRNESPSPTPKRYTFDFRVEAPVRDVWEGLSQMSGFCSNSSGRTLKRYRDDRPDEAVVYATTFQKLFAAQRQPSSYSTQSLNSLRTLPPDAMELSEASVAEPNVRQQPRSQLQQQPRSQASLHMFFQIKSAPSSNTMPVVSEDALHDALQCEDCDRLLSNGGMEDDTVMVDDGFSADRLARHWKCQTCSRRVCDHCCAVGMGTDRSCLQCWRAS